MEPVPPLPLAGSETPVLHSVAGAGVIAAQTGGAVIAPFGMAASKVKPVVTAVAAINGMLIDHAHVAGRAGAFALAATDTFIQIHVPARGKDAPAAEQGEYQTRFHKRYRTDVQVLHPPLTRCYTTGYLMQTRPGGIKLVHGQCFGVDIESGQQHVCIGHL